MDNDEFMRAVEEGKAALKESREHLKNNPLRPADWEKITPETLKAAVKYIRRELEITELQLAAQIECGCYLSFHPELAIQPRFKGGENLIPLEKRHDWQLHYKGMKESKCLAYWIREFSEVLENKIILPFNSFLKIGLAQQSHLDLPPVEWARSLTEGLLYSLEWTVPHLIKRMCDEQEDRLELNIENFDAHCAWVYWRAPRFVYMLPLGDIPYNASTAWQRVHDARITEGLLRGLTRKMLDPAALKVHQLGGEAYVSLACNPASIPNQTENGSSAFRQPRTVAGKDMNIPSKAPSNNPDGLPPKKTDLSKYLDQAELTDRQYECFSLKFEYSFTVTAIAERLKISRKTVDEHIHAAKRRMQLSRAKDGACKRSRLNPAE